MKKSLIAVAALAAVGAASAQSSVTLYGIVDTGFGVNQVKTETGGTTTKDRTTGVNPGKSNLSSSRFGFKGQEDLGNGLSAVFALEAGFNSGNGNWDGGFNRRSVVGLKGGFGQVLLGRDWTPMDSIANDYQAIDVTTGDTVHGLGTNPLYTDRIDGIHYSGEFGGVGVKASVGYNDVKNTTVGSEHNVRTETYGLGVSYAGGPLTVGGAVQYFRDKDTTTNTPVPGLNGTRNKGVEYGVGATYDFTAAKLYAHYLAKDGDFTTYTGGVASKVSGKPVQQAGVGVTVPFGAFTLGAQYAYNYHKASDNTKAKGHDFALQGIYSLSKRTDVYARAARVDSWKIKTSGVTTRKVYTDVFSVGLRHRF